MIAIYVHIPFCRTRCPYCDFVSEAVSGDPPRNYVDAIIREINEFSVIARGRITNTQSDQAPSASHSRPSSRHSRANGNPYPCSSRRFRSHARCGRPPDRPGAPTEGLQFSRQRRGAEPGTLKREQHTWCGNEGIVAGAGGVRSVFFGGGTPSLLAPSALQRILDAIRNHIGLRPGAEITLEANPDDVTPGLADAWRDMGINRVSLGVQHFDDRVLRYLGRRHDGDTARRACAIIAERFVNWNLDLIFGVPPLEAWDETLAACAAIAPPHIAAYGLTYEPGTPFERRAGDAVGEETWLDLYQRAEAAFAGYDHYEISNYARPGFQCAHNLVYWRNEEYVGFGTGAYSFLDGVRARNHPETAQYLARPGEKAESLRLSEREIRIETLIQHFRLRAGVSKTYYRSRFGCDVRGDFGPQCDALIRRGLLEEDAESIRPTAMGFPLNNEIGLALVE